MTIHHTRQWRSLPCVTPGCPNPVPYVRNRKPKNQLCEPCQLVHAEKINKPSQEDIDVMYTL